MAKNWLEGAKSSYDIVVIGSGLGGLTAANYLAKLDYKVLLLEHHYQLGGLATWFKRPRRHIFDISLHGFPIGMIKSCRKYWTEEIAKSIVQLKNIRFVNPQFKLSTTFDRKDFTRILRDHFKVIPQKIEAFFAHLRQMNYYDKDDRTTGELFNEFFPDRSDVHRFLLEPITYANGTTFEDPAIAYGIVFSNFMSKGVYIYQGGTDQLIQRMLAEMKKNGVDVHRNCSVESILTEKSEEGRRRVSGVLVKPRGLDTCEIKCKAVLSNANIKNTIFKLVGEEKFPSEYIAEAKNVRLNISSCQVYMGIRKGCSIPNIGDLVFTSDTAEYSLRSLTDFHTTSRTFSVYYPDTRPQNKTERYSIVASINAKWTDWNRLSDDDYATHKTRLCENAISGLEKFIPDIRSKIDWIEAATPRTIHHYTRHFEGTAFGTKFEGLKVSMELSQNLSGLYHAGSVGIIMSGWLGTINYGVITASKVDTFIKKIKNERNT